MCSNSLTGRVSDIKKGRISGTTLSSAINIITPPDPHSPKIPNMLSIHGIAIENAKVIAKKLQTPARTCSKA